MATWMVLILSLARGMPYDCGRILALESGESIVNWDDLPGQAEHGFPLNFKRALERNEHVVRLARQYGPGDQLNFDPHRIVDGDANGWAIQALFLRKLLRHLFPRATFGRRTRVGRATVPLVIVDSSLTGQPQKRTIEILDLKFANPGVLRRDPGRLRRVMNLPLDARIASLYASWTHRAQTGSVVAGLLDKDLVDVVILSAQDQSVRWPRLFDRTQFPHLKCLTNEDLIRSKPPPAGRTVVLNFTRGRMPYVHGAADFAVILGMANAIEPLAAGRPVYVTGAAARGFRQHLWDDQVDRLRRTGGAQVFENVDDLAERIAREDHVEPRIAPYELECNVNRLMRQIEDVITLATLDPAP